jgi:hypothetical protein
VHRDQVSSAGQVEQVAAFIAASCVVDDTVRESATDLYAAFAAWCRAVGRPALTVTAFGRRLSKLGYHPSKASVIFRRGLRIALPPSPARGGERGARAGEALAFWS